VASLTLIIPTVRRDAFDDPAWLFDLKLDGFRGLADTIASRMLSKNGNQSEAVRAAVGDAARRGRRRGVRECIGMGGRASVCTPDTQYHLEKLLVRRL
jgi:hypothetical protein